VPLPGCRFPRPGADRLAGRPAGRTPDHENNLKERRMLETVDRPAVNNSQRAFYHEQGYLILRDFFSAELMAEASAEADALLRRHDLIAVENLRCRWQPNVHTSACEFETFDPVIDLGPICHRIAHDGRLLAALAALYGEEACLFKDKLIFKPPGLKG